LSPYLFAVYLDDLSIETKQHYSWVSCHMGEILMNHLMFADDICVFCPSVCGLESVLNVCQAYAESHEIIFNCHKTIRMTFKAKTAKSAVIPIAVARYTKSKICCPLQNFGAVRDIELSDDKNIQRQL